MHVARFFATPFARLYGFAVAAVALVGLQMCRTTFYPTAEGLCISNAYLFLCFPNGLMDFDIRVVLKFILVVGVS